MDKDKYIWKQRNEILHKKVNRQMTEIKDLHKKSETIFDLARRFPNKTYVELEKYRHADRQEEADRVPLTESQKKQEELEPLAKGVCVTGALRKDREPQSALDRAKRNRDDLYNRVAELIEINESHHKLNGKLQERITELEEENKKLHAHVERQTTGARKAGM